MMEEKENQLKDEFSRLAEKITVLNERLVKETKENILQPLVDEWLITLKQLYDVMRKILIETGHIYLVEQLHKCWICHKAEAEAQYTNGIIICNHTECKDYFHYWCMCKTLYGEPVNELFSRFDKEGKIGDEVNRVMYG